MASHKEIDVDLLRLELDKEKWQAELAVHEREFVFRERELVSREAEVSLKREEQAASRWRNPLVVAILAAAIAGIGNAFVAALNGALQRDLESTKRDAEFRLEESKAESSRILEMIKTGDPEKAANNLTFLLDTELVTAPSRVAPLRKFLANRQPGTGPSLPAPTTRFAFEPTEALTGGIQQSLENLISEYVRFLELAELKTDMRKVSIKIESLSNNETANYDPDGAKLLIDPNSVRIVYFVISPYTWHVLVSAVKLPPSLSPSFLAVANGVTHFLMCSFIDLNRASLAGKQFVLDVPRCDQLKAESKSTEDATQRWLAAIWAIRQRVGADTGHKIAVRAWLKFERTSPSPEANLDTAFGEALLAATGELAPAHLAAVDKLLATRRAAPTK